MSCVVERRDRIRAAAEHCGARPDVAAVDVLAPDAGPHAGWTLEVTVESERVPAGVLRELALQQCDLLDVSPQGPAHTVVVATN